jgi:hypothetical protein
MSRGRASLIVAGILLVSAAGAAVLIWQAKAHAVPLNYVVGALMVATGAGFSALHLSVGDEYLRQHFGGDENAAQVRRLWRGGWVGVLLGAAIVAAQYLLGGGP